jgi:hypothetical protein
VLYYTLVNGEGSDEKDKEKKRKGQDEIEEDGDMADERV